MPTEESGSSVFTRLLRDLSEIAGDGPRTSSGVVPRLRLFVSRGSEARRVPRLPFLAVEGCESCELSCSIAALLGEAARSAGSSTADALAIAPVLAIGANSERLLMELREVRVEDLRSAIGGFVAVLLAGLLVFVGTGPTSWLSISSGISGKACSGGYLAASTRTSEAISDSGCEVSTASLTSLSAIWAIEGSPSTDAEALSIPVCLCVGERDDLEDRLTGEAGCCAAGPRTCAEGGREG